MSVYLIEPDGTRVPLPPCSQDWQPSAFWVISCIHDPVGPVCRAHLNFFHNRNRKVARP